MGLSPTVIEVSLERLHMRPGCPAFGVARVSRSAVSKGSLAVGQRLLAPTPVDGAEVFEVEAKRCVPLHDELSLERALLVPDLSLALAICDTAGLELGETAICTSGAPHHALVARVAEWRTCRDVIILDLHDGSIGQIESVQQVDGSDPQRAIERIQAFASAATGFAAVVFSRKAEALDILFESMPTWGRLVIASRASDPATIDFYNNVHRKGVTVTSLPATPDCIFEIGLQSCVLPFTQRAMRLLQRDELAHACMASVT